MYSTFHLLAVYIICLAKDFQRYQLQIQNCQISRYLPTANWKIAHFHITHCREFIRGMDEDTRMSWMVSDMLSPQDPSLDAIRTTGERTYTTFPFMRPIYHLAIWFAVTSVLCVKVPQTLALSWLSPFSLYPDMCVGVGSIRLMIHCTGLVSFIEECFAMTPISHKRPSEVLMVRLNEDHSTPTSLLSHTRSHLSLHWESK